MKVKLLFIVCSVIFLTVGQFIQAATIHSYADKSVLSQGNFFKVRITESGIYKLTYSDLINKGIDPSNVRMFGYGGAILEENFLKLKHDDLPEIAIYDAGNAILFYAQGVNKWTYDKANDMFAHQLNTYSNYGYYFVTSDDVGEKKRILQSSELNTASATVNDVSEYTDYRVHEKELHNITRGGREFYGEKLFSDTSIEIPFDFSSLILPSIVRVKMDVANVSTRTLSSQGQETANNKSTFSLGLNGASQQTTVNGNVTSRYEVGIADSKIWNFNVNSLDVRFNLSFANPQQSTAVGYLNFLEVNAQCKLAMQGTVLIFHNKKNIANASYNRYLLETTNPNVVIWDINDILNVTQIPTSSVENRLAFIDSASEAKSYVAIDPTDLSCIQSATILDRVPNQNIHGMEPIDMLIITHPNFVPAANRLAQAHGEINNLRVGVVTTEQVYNEFSSGTPDATAYRWATKMFYDKANNADDRIKYLLLMGKGSYDNRELFQDTGDKYVLTFQAANSLSQTKSYVTDDYFGLLDDNEGLSIGHTDKIDVGIGRFPVRTVEDAEAIVDKTINYIKNQNKSAWKNQLCFIGDNGDNNSHMRQADGFANRMTNSNPSYYVNKILLDAYQQATLSSNKGYPDAQKYFNELLTSGLLFVNYMGHGNTNSWGSILNTAEIRNLKNENLPLFSAGTCEFSRFDKEVVSAGELLLTNQSGGAIGVFSAARTVYSNYNETVMRNFSDILFRDKSSIGHAVMEAKNAAFTSLDLGINTLSYIYFGDPAVKLNYPVPYNILATNINGTPITGSDTLKALSVVTVKGIVANMNGSKVDNFNGNLQLIVQDKEQTKRTLQNFYEYRDRPDVIFKGKTTVRDGEFEITFMLPKNIKYNYGRGRFSFYAWDDENDYEAQGNNENFIVGGINNDFEDERDGPELAIYLNNENFVSGGKVNETPVFLAKLFDRNGINTSSITPGHDLMLCIDNENWYELNDYYEIKQGSYKEGSIVFQLPEQTEGKHILMFRAWDLLSNSTIETLEFEVVKGLDTQVFSVSCYPNPVSTEANIQINYNQESGIKNVVLDVFDLSGRKIWSKNQKTLDTILWNLSGQSEEKVSSGMYVYTVTVQANDGTVFSKSNKIIVAKQ